MQVEFENLSSTTYWLDLYIKKKVENSTQILFKSLLFHPQFILIIKKDIYVQSMQLILYNNLKAVVNQIYFPFKGTITKAYHHHS